MQTKKHASSKWAQCLKNHHYVLRALVLVGFLVIALVGFSTPKAVNIRINDATYVAHTSKAYVSQVISEFIDLNSEMNINVERNAPITDEMDIVISTPKQIQVTLGTSQRQIETTALQVKDFLVEQGLTEQTGYTLTNADIEMYLTDTTTLRFDHTIYTEETTREIIEPVIEYEDDATLAQGEEVVAQTGEAMEIERTYNVRTVNEAVVERTLLDETVVVAGQPTIIKVGTKVAPVVEPVVANEQAVVENEVIEPQLGTMPMKMTFYGCSSCGSASGIPVDSQTKRYEGMRILSADWSILPAGSIVNVPGWGKAIVLDTGVSGNHIDMFIGTDPVPSHGVENPTIEIIRLGW